MIIGITGTDGAGKGAAVDHLVKKHSFTHYSSRASIETEVAKRGLEATRENLRLVANDMRGTDGRDVLVQRALERIVADTVHDAVIESIRAVAEAETLVAEGGILLAVDADPKERYRRITGRKSSSDNVSYEEFLAHEAMEMSDTDPNGMQKAKVMEMADYTIMNNRSLAALRKDVDAFLASLAV